MCGEHKFIQYLVVRTRLHKIVFFQQFLVVGPNTQQTMTKRLMNRLAADVVKEIIFMTLISLVMVTSYTMFYPYASNTFDRHFLLDTSNIRLFHQHYIHLVIHRAVMNMTAVHHLTPTARKSSSFLMHIDTIPEQLAQSYYSESTHHSSYSPNLLSPSGT